MRYYYEKPTIYSQVYGSIYKCDRPVYSECTLFKINNRGLAVIQQRYCYETKSTHWNVIDPWLIDELYLHTRFESFFNERAGEIQNGLYPTVAIQQMMWGLKLKPLPRERLETCFDRRVI